MSYPVQLYLYDLSHGMARMYSGMFLGKTIDAIWHTSITVYGKEYFFGWGVQWAAPGTTPHGQPLRVVDLGTTTVDPATFEDYVEGLARDRYAVGTYHLLEHNCNTFSAEVSLFLTGRPIPSYVSNLPADVLDSPFGPTIRSFVDSFMGGARTSPSTHTVLPSAPTPSAAHSVDDRQAQTFSAGRREAILAKLDELHGKGMDEAEKTAMEGVRKAVLGGGAVDSAGLTVLGAVLGRCAENVMFPVLDALRLLALNSSNTALFAKTDILASTLAPVLAQPALSPPSILSVLRTLANMAALPEGRSYLTASTQRLDQVALLVGIGLENSLNGVRVVAAALSANLALGLNSSHAESDPYIHLLSALTQRVVVEDSAPEEVGACVLALYRLVGEEGHNAALVHALLGESSLTNRLPKEHNMRPVAERLYSVLQRHTQA